MKITVLGAGAMGTACAAVLAETPGRSISLWARNPEYARQMQHDRENRRLLPGIRIPDAVEVTSDLSAAADESEVLVISIPTAFLRDALTQHRELLIGTRTLVSVIKGIENDTFLRPSEIMTEILNNERVVVLAGPSHAEEIGRRQPASLVAAARRLKDAVLIQELFTTDRFRVYTNDDPVGVELGGALKNVLAIAVGICDGLELGDNAKAALMTRGLVEMRRFGTALGAAPETLFGLAGIGDLITTCISRFSRNRHVGERLGRGERLEQILDSMPSVAEGVRTTRSVHALAEEHKIDMPITREVYAVLFNGQDALSAIDSLMNRAPRGE